MSVLRLENVKKTFEGGPEVLRGISLAVGGRSSCHYRALRRGKIHPAALHD